MIQNCSSLLFSKHVRTYTQRSAFLDIPRSAMAPSSDVSDEIKRSDFGSLKRSLSTTASSSQGSDEIEKSNVGPVKKLNDAVASTSNDPDKLKSKVGSKKSITTVGSSTLVPSETLISNVGSLRKSPEKGYTPLRKPTFSNTSTFTLTDSSKSSMVFRRFDCANARRLLVLEAEIAELEERLEKKEWENANGTAFELPEFSSKEKERHLSRREREGEMKELGQLLDRKVEKYCTQPHIFWICAY